MNAATRRIARQTTLHDENRVQHTRVTRSKLASTTEITTTTTTALPSKVGNNNAVAAGTRKRAALGDVTNARKKPALGDVTNAIVKKDGEKPAIKRPISRKTSAANVKKPAESKPLASKQTITNNPSVVIPKKRSSEAVAAPPPRRTLTQSTSTSSLAQKSNARVAPARRRADEVSAEQEEPRKKQKVEAAPKPDWDDLDAADANDPLMVSDYVVEIFNYLRELEMKTMPNPSYMKSQVNLEWRMRGILVDWLIEVHAKFRLLPETLFLCVNLVDRFLSARPIKMEKLQLVGVTALLVASKYEEVMAPAIDAFIYVADGGYTEEEILKAERYLLHIVGFDLSYPNPMNFLRRISKADDYDIYTRTIAKYLIEISLVDDRFLKYTPSILAAAGMYLARHMMDRGPWSPNLVHYSGYSAAEVRPVVRLMIDYLARREVLHEAFFKKYAAKKYMKASIIVREWIRTQYAEEEITTLTQTTTTTNIKTESQLDDDFEDLGKENAQVEEYDFERSDEDDYMFANELEDREVDEGFQMIR